MTHIKKWMEEDIREGKCSMIFKWFRGLENVKVCLNGSAFALEKSTIGPAVMETKGQGYAGQGYAGQSWMARQVRKEHSGKTVIL